MSVSHEVHKIAGTIRRAVSDIATRSNTDLDGALRGTRKILGYVCAIHEDGELAGTIDVQEYNFEPDEYEVKGTRHHKGVLLSAIQDNSRGSYIVPVLYSEVIIVQNPVDGKEYVLMYSHARTIKLQSHEDIEIGVTEYEDFVETDNGLVKDYDELEPTRNKTLTRYEATSIIDHITSPEDEEGFRQEKTVEHKVITVGDTKITIDGTSVTIETSKEVKVKSENVNVECADCTVSGTTITLTGGTLKTKGQSSTDMQGPFNPIKVCPFSGAPHCGSSVSGT